MQVQLIEETFRHFVQLSNEKAFLDPASYYTVSSNLISGTIV